MQVLRRIARQPSIGSMHAAGAAAMAAAVLPDPGREPSPPCGSRPSSSRSRSYTLARRWRRRPSVGRQHQGALLQPLRRRRLHHHPEQERAR
jgi:hypothetical protein